MKLNQPTIPVGEFDFKSASLEELLREVELLDLPELASPLTLNVPSIQRNESAIILNKPE